MNSFLDAFFLFSFGIPKYTAVGCNWELVIRNLDKPRSCERSCPNSQLQIPNSLYPLIPVILPAVSRLFIPNPDFMALIVVGSMAFDAIETPFGKVDKIV